MEFWILSFVSFLSVTQQDNLIPQFKNMLCRVTQEDNQILRFKNFLNLNISYVETFDKLEKHQVSFKLSVNQNKIYLLN